jgi:hypothetical protein
MRGGCGIFKNLIQVRKRVTWILLSYKRIVKNSSNF